MKNSFRPLIILAICFFAIQFSYGQCAPDATVPVITCPADATVSCIAEVPDAAESYADLVALGGDAEDFCTADADLVISFSDVAVGSCPTTLTRTYTVEDEAGNTAECNQVYQIIDDEEPVFANCLLDTLLYVDNACDAALELTAPAISDNCGIASAEYVIESALDTTAAVPFTSAEVLNLNFTTGEYTIKFRVFDACNNVDSCLVLVDVVDTIFPELLAPADMTITLPADACDTVLTIEGFTVSDNCPLSMGGDFDFLGLTQIEGIPLGDPYAIGEHMNVYMMCDSMNNCVIDTLLITIEEHTPVSFGSLTSFNLSVNELCEGNLTPEMVLLGDVGCFGNCSVIVTDDEGNTVPNLFTGNDIGKSFTYTVICSDNLSSGIVNVEDKFPPQIECEPDTITVGELLAYPTPTITENCSGAFPELVNEVYAKADCNDPEIEILVTRTYKAVDAAGNESNVCEQVLSLEKFDIGTVQDPILQTINLDCSDDFPKDANGGPDPEFYGSPRLNGFDIYPANFIDFSILATYSDEYVQTSQNDYTILRIFEVTHWNCGGDTTRTFGQIFNITDSSGPEFTCPGDMSFTTAGKDCTADVELPALDVVDLCSEVASVSIQYQGGFINGNGGIAHLPNGFSTVTYTAEDTEGNKNSCSFEVFVSDNEQPIPVCEQFTEVTLTNQGSAIVNASTFDDGSFDPCGDVTIQVRRMNPSCDAGDAVFGESVTFCCADLGAEEMVILRVTDESGNTNECMVSVEVQDNVPPVLVQGLPDITLSCEFPFNENDTEQFGSIQFDVDDIENIELTAELVQFGGPATDGLVLGNCIELVSEEIVNSNFNSCGIGSAQRVLTFANSQGVTVTDVQNITFENPSPFTSSDIAYPGDLFFSNVCDISTLDPVSLPAGFQYPVITEDGCDQVGFEYEDSVNDVSDGAQSCYVITRTWSIVDWCQNVGGVFEVFEGVQTITVVNTIAPELLGSCENVEVNSLDPNCGPIFVELVNSASDDCTAPEFLNISYEIDLDSDGSLDVTGATADASGEYPVGNHTISWLVTDGCGNQDACSYTFTLNNTKLPSPKCLDNLTADLTPTDTDGDGIDDTEEVSVTPDMFDAGSDDPCGTPVILSFSSDVNDVLRTYGCEDIGENIIELWVTDENGNQDFCITSFEVQDNNGVNLCPPAPLNVDVFGELKTESSEMIALGEVTLEGGNLMDVTEDDGMYDFSDMPKGGDYTIKPKKDIDPANGISVADIILIQKHILGLSPLDSPLKILAADVDNNQKVNGGDIIQIRKLLLGYFEEFPQNTSWRFVDENHIFMDPANPWMSDIAETYEIYNLDQNMVVNFKGYKVGDVNGSASPNDLVGEVVETRTNTAQQLTYDVQDVKRGEQRWISLNKEAGESIEALQLALSFDDRKVEVLDIQSEMLDLTESMYRISGNEIRMILTGSSIDNSTEEALIKVLVEAKVDLSTKDIITINEESLRSEAYTQSLEVQAIELVARDADLVSTNVEFSLKQNEPNPWMTSTSIIFTTPRSGEGTMNLLDMNGKVVKSVTQAFAKGENSIVIDRNDVSAGGVYYYEIVFGDLRMMKKMIVIK